MNAIDALKKFLAEQLLKEEDEGIMYSLKHAEVIIDSMSNPNLADLRVIIMDIWSSCIHHMEMLHMEEDKWFNGRVKGYRLILDEINKLFIKTLSAIVKEKRDEFSPPATASAGTRNVPVKPQLNRG